MPPHTHAHIPCHTYAHMLICTHVHAMPPTHADMHVSQHTVCIHIPCHQPVLLCMCHMPEYPIHTCICQPHAHVCMYMSICIMYMHAYTHIWFGITCPSKCPLTKAALIKTESGDPEIVQELGCLLSSLGVSPGTFDSWSEAGCSAEGPPSITLQAQTAQSPRPSQPAAWLYKSQTGSLLGRSPHPKKSLGVLGLERKSNSFIHLLCMQSTLFKTPAQPVVLRAHS